MRRFFIICALLLPLTMVVQAQTPMWPDDPLGICPRFDDPVPLWEPGMPNEVNCNYGGTTNDPESVWYNPYDQRDSFNQRIIIMNNMQFHYNSSTAYVRLPYVSLAEGVDTLSIRVVVFNIHGHLGYECCEGLDPDHPQSGPGTQSSWMKIYDAATGELAVDYRLEEHFDEVEFELVPGMNTASRALFHIADRSVLPDTFTIEFGFHAEVEWRSSSLVWYITEQWNTNWIIHPDPPVSGEGGPRPGSVLTLSTYPNPTQGRVTVVVDTHEPKDNVELVLYDLLGREVRRYGGLLLPAGSESAITWDLSSLPSGTYLLVLQDGNRRLTQRLVTLL